MQFIEKNRDLLNKECKAYGYGSSRAIARYESIDYKLVKFNTGGHTQACREYKDKMSRSLERDGYYYCDGEHIKGDWWNYYIMIPKEVIEEVKHVMCEGQIGSISARVQKFNKGDVALIANDKVMIAGLRIVDGIDPKEFYASAIEVK